MVFYRVDYRGSIYGTENFQHGFSCNSPDTAAGVASDCASEMLTYLATAAPAGDYRSDVVWTDVNVSEVGATPSDPVVTSAQAAIGDGGTTTADTLPPQCSMVVSLRTATAGSRARGRMYLPPMIASTVSTNGRFTAGTVSDQLAAWDAFFTALVAAAHAPGVLSGVGGEWTFYPLTSIRIGNVVDTQRRRRSQLAETYSVAAI